MPSLDRKTISPTNDTTTTKTLLHEAVPVTGTILSGTYNDSNIKNYAHGMFQSVYDYPYLSSSANHIFDIAIGYSSGSAMSSSTSVQDGKKRNLYNQMAQFLVGYDADNNVREFDKDGDFAGGTKMKEMVFLNFSRLLTKDEIKKQSFTLTFLTGGTPANRQVGTGGEKYVISDYNAISTFKANSPAGEYGFLYSGSQATAGTAVGLLYYQAGVAALTASVFSGSKGGTFGFSDSSIDTSSVEAVFTGSNISSSCDAVRNAWYDCSFNNTTELNSAIYFCRVNHNDFNFSNNPTYLSSSKIRVKERAADEPLSYITTVGLYSADNVLLAVAKLSEPLKKTPSNEFTLRVRLDY